MQAKLKNLNRRIESYDRLVARCKNLQQPVEVNRCLKEQALLIKIRDGIRLRTQDER